MSIIIIVFFSLVILIKAILVRLVIKFKVPRSGQHEYVRSYYPCSASPSLHKPSLNKDRFGQNASMPLHQTNDTWIPPSSDG